MRVQARRKDMNAQIPEVLTSRAGTPGPPPGLVGRGSGVAQTRASQKDPPAERADHPGHRWTEKKPGPGRPACRVNARHPGALPPVARVALGLAPRLLCLSNVGPSRDGRKGRG